MSANIALSPRHLGAVLGNRVLDTRPNFKFDRFEKLFRMGDFA